MRSDFGRVLHMEKTLFVYQRWFLRILCSTIMLPVVFLLQMLIAKLIGAENMSFWLLLLFATLAFIGMTVYYKYTQHHRCFLRSGAYWVSDGIVYIEKGNEVHALTNVKWLNGTIVSVYGMAKSGMLVIQDGKKKIVLVSSTESINAFSDSPLLPLFKLILEHNPKLVKDNYLDFWYERKE